jgi:predicted RNA-binding protein associated with RNAse of E/G family
MTTTRPRPKTSAQRIDEIDAALRSRLISKAQADRLLDERLRVMRDLLDEALGPEPPVAEGD